MDSINNRKQELLVNLFIISVDFSVQASFSNIIIFLNLLITCEYSQVMQIITVNYLFLKCNEYVVIPNINQ